MREAKTGRTVRKVGRPHKSIRDDGKPRTTLALELRSLKVICGDPSYRALERSTGIYQTGLKQAAGTGNLPVWEVIEGYVCGCWAYYQRRNGNPIEGAGDFSRWRQLFSAAGGTLPEERPSENGSTSQEKTKFALMLRREIWGSQEIATNTRMSSAFSKFSEHWLSRARRPWIRLVSGIALCVKILIAALIMSKVKSGEPGAVQPAHSATNYNGQSGQDDAGMDVPQPAPQCGLTGEDGLRSPAETAFIDRRVSYVVSLDGFSAIVMHGKFNGIAYEWVESHPTGMRAGFQLRWSDAPHKWHYCTVTLPTGAPVMLPNLVSTVAVPVDVLGRPVLYQACIWHQNPYTAQCSPLGI